MVKKGKFCFEKPTRNLESNGSTNSIAVTGNVASFRLLKKTRSEKKERERGLSQIFRAAPNLLNALRRLLANGFFELTNNGIPKGRDHFGYHIEIEASGRKPKVSQHWL